jgi:hypothetical protein
MPRIRVKVKSTGKTGTVEEKDFNSAIFERIGDGVETTNAGVEKNVGVMDRLGGLLKGYAYDESTAPISEHAQSGNALSRFIGNYMQPVESGLRYGAGSGVMLGEAISGLLGSKTGAEESLRGNIPFLNKEQEVAARSGSPLPSIETGARAGSGILSASIPVGKGKLAALTGFVRGFSSQESKPDSTVGESIKSGLTASVMEPILASIVPFLKKSADSALVRGGIKRLGKPTASEGGVPAVTEWKKLGLNTNSIDELGDSATDIISNDGRKLSDEILRLSKKGAKVDRDEILRYLYGLLDDAKTPEMKAPINNAITSVEKTFGTEGAMSLEEFHKVKQNWGDQGRFSELNPAKETEQARIFNDLYIKANDIINEHFSKETLLGESTIFKNLNAKVSAAKDAQSFVRRIRLKTAPSGLPVGFNETLRLVLDNPDLLETYSKSANVASRVYSPLADFLTRGAVISRSNNSEEGYKY